jgi:hypothetical protein
MRIGAALIQARSRQETLSELNRLLRKRFPNLPQRYFTEERSEVRREWLTAEQLAQFNAGHTRVLDPHRTSGPLIACEYRGQTYMLDGTNRLNVWLRDGDKTLHATIIVRNGESYAA